MSQQTVDPFSPLTAPAAPAAPSAVPTGPEGGKGDSAPAAATEGASGGRKRTGVASGGRPVEDVPEMPAPPVWPQPTNPDEVYVPDEEFDASDLSQVNRNLNACRARLFRVSQQLKAAQRELAEADLAYSRRLRRELVTLSGGSAEQRKAIAELKCEDAENRLVLARQVAEEWKKRAQDVRDDLKAAENLSHNVRAQMDIR